MSRARNIKPGFFTNGDLLECEPLARLLFAGLWCEADRRGILEDRPKTIKVKVLPGDNCDIDRLLNQLAERGFIERYEARGIRCIRICAFDKHQNPHVKEQENDLPGPDETGESTGFEDDSQPPSTGPEGQPDTSSPIQELGEHDTGTGPAPVKHHGSPADSLNLDSPSLNPAAAAAPRVRAPAKAAAGEPEVGSAHFPVRDKPRQTPIPDGWEPSAETLEIGRMAGLTDPQITVAVQDFRDFAKRKALIEVDWQASAQRWLRREPKFQETARAPNGAKPVPIRANVIQRNEDFDPF